MEKFIDTDEWVPVHTLPGFEACIEYYVNRKGQVKSTKYKQDRILKWRKHTAGYPMICLTQRIGKGRPLDVCVHKLVAFAFLPPPPLPYGRRKGYMIIDHIDNDKTNPNADNLRWVTWKQSYDGHEEREAAKKAKHEAKLEKKHRSQDKDYDEKWVKIEESLTL